MALVTTFFYLLLLVHVKRLVVEQAATVIRASQLANTTHTIPTLERGVGGPTATDRPAGRPSSAPTIEHSMAATRSRPSARDSTSSKYIHTHTHAHSKHKDVSYCLPRLSQPNATTQTQRAHCLKTLTEHTGTHDMHTTWDDKLKNASTLQGGRVRKVNTQLRPLPAKKSNLATCHAIGNTDK